LEKRRDEMYALSSGILCVAHQKFLKLMATSQVNGSTFSLGAASIVYQSQSHPRCHMHDRKPFRLAASSVHGATAERRPSRSGAQLCFPAGGVTKNPRTTRRDRSG
jgi:hypothetical protein